MLIKLCGFRLPAVAFRAAQLGADFVGLLYAPGARRSVFDVGQLVELSAAIRAGGATPVLVAGDVSAVEILPILKRTGIKYVQCHGDLVLSQASHYLGHVACIRVVSTLRSYNFHKKLLKKDDFILFDHIPGGQGSLLPFCPGQKIWTSSFIAGGIGLENIDSLLDRELPLGVDLSGGVENTSGLKCLSKIESFLLRCREVQNAC